MAVKKREVVQDNPNQVDLVALMHYIELMNEQPNYLPPPQELIKCCQDIVKCLARSSFSNKLLCELLQAVEEFLVRVINLVSPVLRHEIVTAILDKFYSFISDPQSEACPVTSVVLVVLDMSDSEAILSAIRRLVQQGDNGSTGAGLKASLSCLYRWMYEWHGTPALGDWILAYIKALEENERFDILVEVSVDNLETLFLAMANPVGLRHSVTEIVFHVLASLRESTEALERISPHVDSVLTNLAAESGQWSRQLLQNVVDILTAMVDGLLESLKGEAQDAFRTKHADVIKCLERHMASRSCRFLQLQPWKTRTVSPPSPNTHTTLSKVGLLNLGNTCYMNSVMQALLLTRQFSSHVVLKMNEMPYWSKMGLLFAKMMHSITNKLNPNDFFSLVKPPFFTHDDQHDSSEFLGYLLTLLQSHEHVSNVNFNYSRPTMARVRTVTNVSHGSSSHCSHTSVNENAESSTNRRSVSPRPGSSAAVSKRLPSNADLCLVQKKRVRLNESASLLGDSYIDNMFGGILLTRVECADCHTVSYSRDVFRDLQLAFPEKPEDRQHSVQSLLEYYCSKERLSGDNRYQCRDCGELRDAERCVFIESSPKYLILVLKNFKFEPKLQVQTKLMHSIYHNHTVTLPAVHPQVEHSTYVLYAAVIHDGTTLDCGHYYTLAKDNDQWYMYNDETVSVADETLLNGLNRSSTPYILFYRRSDIEEGTAPSMDELPPKLQKSVMAHNKCYVKRVRKLRVSRRR